MNLLDENFPKDQLPLLNQWRITFRQIGRDFARLGVKDPDIVPLLHRQRGVTFFTLDWDFFEPALCHPAYCLAWLDVQADDAAYFVRRFLKHSSFNTVARRMDKVVRIHREGLNFWQRNRPALQRVPWLRTAKK